jgi:hypothetical protein
MAWSYLTVCSSACVSICSIFDTAQLILTKFDSSGVHPKFYCANLFGSLLVPTFHWTWFSKKKKKRLIKFVTNTEKCDWLCNEYHKQRDVQNCMERFWNACLLEIRYCILKYFTSLATVRHEDSVFSYKINTRWPKMSVGIPLPFIVAWISFIIYPLFCNSDAYLRPNYFQ